MKILVIDDSQSMRLLISKWVSSLGHQVFHAETGQQGVDYVKQNDVDLIMMDIEMPDLNGFETTRAIRELNADDWFPIIFLTSKTDDESYAKGVKAGGDAYLVKPINPLRLQMQILAMERIYKMRLKLQSVQNELLLANQALTHTSLHDQLTGLANRRHFDINLPREFEQAKREKEPLSLIMCDIDYFKAYNDYYGHVAGDGCLKKVAETIASLSHRATDLLCRYGGEEFAVILPRTDLHGGLKVAEKIREAVVAEQIPHRGSKAGEWVSLSLGLATYKGQFKSITDLMEAADNALYRSKKNGRNCVQTA
ncbi:MAG: GGDEF domain-containing response regulator [Gammaproteobacteria bacterium]